LDERKRIEYWKQAAFNIVTKISPNSYIQYKENYHGRGKLKAKL
jgi:hypothetical protein